MANHAKHAEMVIVFPSLELPKLSDTSILRSALTTWVRIQNLALLSIYPINPVRHISLFHPKIPALHFL